jgi:hypothetical protein
MVVARLKILSFVNKVELKPALSMQGTVMILIPVKGLQQPQGASTYGI